MRIRPPTPNNQSRTKKKNRRRETYLRKKGEGTRNGRGVDHVTF